MRLFQLAFIFCLLSAKMYGQVDGNYSNEKPPITPAWAMEPWIWEDNGNTGGTVEQLVRGYEDHDIPFGVVMIDSPWETAYNTFQWDTIRYPNPKQMIKALHDKGLKVVVWMTANMNKTGNDQPLPMHPDYNWLIKKKYVVDNGKPWKWWKGDGVHIDFTNKKAVDWLHHQMDNVLDMGIDGWKTDNGANKPDGGTFLTSDGILRKRDFRALYYADIYDYTIKKNPEAIILARPFSHQGGFASTKSKCAVGWCGDFTGDWEGLKQQIDNIYRSANAGYGVIACEVGGFMSIGYPNKESFIRYTQFGALCPAMINGGSNGGLTNHLPWYYDDETVEIYRYYAALHSELVPYIFSNNVHAHLTGEPIIRNTDIENAQHTLGEFLFVASVTEDELYKHINFPENGYWINYWKEEEVIKGGVSKTFSSDLKMAPIFIKAGAIIPMQVTNNITNHAKAKTSKEISIFLYPYKESELTYYRNLGSGTDYVKYMIEMNEEKGSVSIRSDALSDFQLIVKSFSHLKSVSGANHWTYDEEHKLLIIDVESDDPDIKIDGLKGHSVLID